MPHAAGRAAQESVERLLERIATVDVRTNAVCTLNPVAGKQAASLDREASDGRRRSALHG